MKSVYEKINYFLAILLLLIFTSYSALGAQIKLSDLPVGTGAGSIDADRFVYINTQDSNNAYTLPFSDFADIPSIAAALDLKADLTGATFSGAVAATGFTGPLTGNASTATALASNPTDCSAGDFATTIAANGNLTCSRVNATVSDFTPTVGGDWTTSPDSVQDALDELGARSGGGGGGSGTVNSGSAGRVAVYPSTATVVDDVYVQNSNDIHINIASHGSLAATRTYSIPEAGADASFVMTEGNQTINGTKTFGSTITGSISGNAGTATALAANPSDCSSDQFATTIAANGNLTCAQVAADQVGFTPNVSGDWDSPPTEVAGALDELADRVETLEGSSGGGTVNAGTAGYLAVYPSSTTAVDDTYVQNANDIHVAIASHGSLAATRTYTIPEVGASASFVMDQGTQTIAGTKTFSSTITGSISGNAGTASALAANPTDCSTDQFANAIAANGNLTCAQVAADQVGFTPTTSGDWDSPPTEVAGALDELAGRVDTLESSGGGAAADTSLELTNVGLSASVGSSQLTLALKQKDGSTDPSSGSGAVKIAFRSSTAGTGGYVQRSVTGALSTVISSGSTLGSRSGKPNWIYVYAIDNAGTVELAYTARKLADEGALYNTTAEGGAGAADDKYTLYSTTARTGVAVRLIAYVKSTQATAGTWATTPSNVAIMPFQMSMPTDEMMMSGCSGYGGTSTSVHQLTTTEFNRGNAFTITSNGTVGTVVEINEDGVYDISFGIANSNGGGRTGATLNSSSLTGDVNGLSVAELIDVQNGNTGDDGVARKGGREMFLVAGDLIRLQGNPTLACDTSTFAYLQRLMIKRTGY